MQLVRELGRTDEVGVRDYARSLEPGTTLAMVKPAPAHATNRSHRATAVPFLGPLGLY